MRVLSISKAWEETRAIVARDGRLFVSVALALIALPETISGLIAPDGIMNLQQTQAWVAIVVVVLGIVVLGGQLALIRLALGPSTSVGDALGHGLKRLPAYVLAALLVGVALFLAAIPFAIALVASGVSTEAKTLPATPVVLIGGLLYFALLIFVFVRMIMATPVASAESAGPIAIIRRSWELTSGYWWPLFGFLLLFFVGAIVLQLAVASAIGLVVLLALGQADAFSASALIIALVEAIVAAAVAVLLMTMLARIYVQLSGRSEAHASVPSSGT
jgi:hypothetical protein